MRGTGRQGSGRITCPTCGGSGQVQGQQSSTYTQPTPSDTATARQRELEEQRQKQAEADGKRQAEFEKAKRDALRSIKGITENELGFKDISASDDFGFKGVGETKTSDLGLKEVGETDLPRTLFDKGTRDSAPVDTRAKGPSKLDVGTPPATLQTVESTRGNTELKTTASQPDTSADLVKEFLFPGKPRPFPENPDKPFLNPLIEQAKAKNLPVRGETADAFTTRFLKSDLFKKLDDTDNSLHPWNDGPVYPRGKYPAVDKVVDETVQRIVDRETAGIKAACQKAVAAMNAEYAKMEKQGIIHPGDDLAAKYKTDDAYHYALVDIHHRVFAQFEKDVQATLIQHDAALDKLKWDIPKMQEDNKSDVEKYLFPANKQ